MTTTTTAIEETILRATQSTKYIIKLNKSGTKNEKAATTEATTQRRFVNRRHRMKVDLEARNWSLIKRKKGREKREREGGRKE